MATGGMNDMGPAGAPDPGAHGCRIKQLEAIPSCAGRGRYRRFAVRGTEGGGDGSADETRAAGQQDPGCLAVHFGPLSTGARRWNAIVLMAAMGRALVFPRWPGPVKMGREFMRVLWICGSRIVGGAERVNIRLAELLRACGHDIEVLCPTRSDLTAAAAAAGLQCHHGPLGRSADFRAALTIRRLLRRGFDAALITTTDEWVWGSLGKLRGGPRLIMARYMALPLAKGVLWLARHRADAIVAISSAVRDTLLERGILEAAQIHVVPHPLTVEPRRHPPGESERRAARAHLGLPPDGRWVGFFGGFSEAKGIGDVIEAIRTASKIIGPIDLLVTDRGGCGEAKAWLGSLGDAGRVHVVGDLPYGRIPVAMTAVEAVVVATRSNVREASSLVLHEALALGTPGVAYATGGIPELFGENGTSGLLATPDDPAALAVQMVRVLSDGKLAERLAAAGIHRVSERCDVGKIIRSYEKLFAGSKP